MSDDWREELIEKMVRSMWYVEPDNNTLMLNELARAALAVAEPVIREQADNALREENARLLKENSELVFRAHVLLWLLPPETTCGELRKARDEMLAATIREGGKNA